MGGDEFCIVVQDNGSETELVVAGAVRALSEHGEGFTISAASGSIALPAEAQEADEALRLADQRMYAQKQSARVSAGDQSSGVLLRALTERHPKLGAHVPASASSPKTSRVEAEPRRRRRSSWRASRAACTTSGRWRSRT